MSELKVVLADDKPSILTGLELVVDWKALGYEIVGTALDGQKAWRLVQELRPHLVLTDIQMPKMNGLELARHIYEQKGPTKVVILSGYDEFEYARTALRYGVEDFLVKPVDEVYLTALLKKLARSILNSRGGLLEQVSVPEVDDQDLVGKVNHYIRTHYREDIRILDLAAKFNVTSAYLGQLFAKRTGSTLRSSVHAVRIEAAKILLATTQLRIYEVADAVGYNDEDLFFRQFKTLTGQSPVAYRKEAATGSE